MSLECVSRLVGNPVLLPGEDPQKYEALFDEIWATIDPADIFERFWVEDLTAQIWEAARYRRMMSKVLVAGQVRVERAEYDRCVVLGGRLPEGSEEEVVSQRVRANWDEGEAISQRAGKLQPVSQMLAKAESRRNATLRALERHREGLGSELRRLAEAFEAAESQEPAAAEEPKLAA